MKIKSLDMQDTLEKARRIRELAAYYGATDDEPTRLKSEGRE